MGNPRSHVGLGEEEACAAEEYYAMLETELQAMRVRNEELMRSLQE